MRSRQNIGRLRGEVTLADMSCTRRALVRTATVNLPPRDKEVLAVVNCYRRHGRDFTRIWSAFPTDHRVLRRDSDERSDRCARHLWANTLFLRELSAIHEDVQLP
jgi:hypothetical protein